MPSAHANPHLPGPPLPIQDVAFHSAGPRSWQRRRQPQLRGHHTQQALHSVIHRIVTPCYRRGNLRSVHAGSQPGWPRTRGPHPSPSSQTHPLNCLHMTHSGPFNNTPNRDGPGLSEGSKLISVTNARSSNFHLRMIPHLYLKTFRMTRLQGIPCSPACSV